MLPIKRYTLFLIPKHEVVSTLKAKIFLQKMQKFPLEQYKLYCKTPVSSSTGRTENIPLLNKRLDDLN